MTHARVQAHAHDAARLFLRVSALALAAFLLLGLAVPAPAAAATIEERRAAVLHYTNKERREAGCKPLVMSRLLTTAAQRHARDMARRNYFAHTSPTGRSWDDRIRATGYDDPGAENIAYGFKRARAVVQAWMNSPSHRRNIMTCSLKKLGVGYTNDDGIWVQDFGY